MTRVVFYVWNLHFTIPIPEIGVPCPMPTKVIGYGRGVMGPTKSILYGDMDRLAQVSKMMGIRSV